LLLSPRIRPTVAGSPGPRRSGGGVCEATCEADSGIARGKVLNSRPGQKGQGCAWKVVPSRLPQARPRRCADATEQSAKSLPLSPDSLPQNGVGILCVNCT
jgi:hypothetical protein